MLVSTSWHRAMRMALRRLFGWITKMWCVVGLTTSLPMIPSSQGPVTRSDGPNCTPAVDPGAPGAGDRAMASWLATASTPWQTCTPEPATTLYARYKFPPFVGSPSVTYHWRSSGVVSTEVQLGGVNVTPWSSDRAAAKFAADRSMKYRWPAVSVARSVSPP